MCHTSTPFTPSLKIGWFRQSRRLALETGGRNGCSKRSVFPARRSRTIGEAWYCGLPCTSVDQWSSAFEFVPDTDLVVMNRRIDDNSTAACSLSVAMVSGAMEVPSGGGRPGGSEDP